MCEAQVKSVESKKSSLALVSSSNHHYQRDDPPFILIIDRRSPRFAFYILVYHFVRAFQLDFFILIVRRKLSKEKMFFVHFI